MTDLFHIEARGDSVTTLRIYMNKHKTTADLYRAVRERDEMKGLRIENMFLDGASIPESEASTLESSGFRSTCTVHLCFTVTGGGGQASKPEEVRTTCGPPEDPFRALREWNEMLLEEARIEREEREEAREQKEREEAREREEREVARLQTMVLDEPIDKCILEPGGGSEASKPEASSPVSFRWTTTEPCCVTDDDDPEVKRAKMPCGCVIGTDALKSHCEEKVEKGWFRFPCANCDEIWPNKAVSEALAATIPDEEFESFVKKLNQNYVSSLPALKACPFCGAYVQRDPSRHYLNVNWVECSVCTKKKGSSVTFCWNCDKAWTGNKESCGNSGCEGKDPRIKILKDCGLAEIRHISVTGVPKLRACVDCGRILEHKEGCKHMTCPCGCEFCFVCLKKKVKFGDKKGWQCGSYSNPCSVAPRQKVIFDFQPMTKP